MYRNCIFCSADLGSNESIEEFPIGRSLAFDAGKGRLWAVCPKCARWNLAPLEERWEAIEAGERLFRGTRLRAQSENVGLAKLRDGTRLIRIGQALGRELAWWRYGELLRKRHRRAVLVGGAVATVGMGAVAAGTLAAPVALGTWITLYRGYEALVRRAAGRRTAGWVDVEVGGVLRRVRLRREDASGAWLSTPDDGQGVALNLPLAVEAPDPHPGGGTRRVPVVLRGSQARGVMARALVHVNVNGAEERQIANALTAIERAGSPDAYVEEIGRRRLALNGADLRQASRPNLGWRAAFDADRVPPPNLFVSLALEMALHEETERRAMEGELAMLEGMWREAEEIAAIADRLPDVPAPQPPRV